MQKNYSHDVNQDVHDVYYHQGAIVACQGRRRLLVTRLTTLINLSLDNGGICIVFEVRAWIT